MQGLNIPLRSLTTPGSPTLVADVVATTSNLATSSACQSPTPPNASDPTTTAPTQGTTGAASNSSAPTFSCPPGSNASPATSGQEGLSRSKATRWTLTLIVFIMTVLTTWWAYASVAEAKRANRLAELAYVEAYRDDCRAQNESQGIVSNDCLKALSKSLPPPQWMDKLLGRRTLKSDTEKHVQIDKSDLVRLCIVGSVLGTITVVLLVSTLRSASNRPSSRLRLRWRPMQWHQTHAGSEGPWISHHVARLMPTKESRPTTYNEIAVADRGQDLAEVELATSVQLNRHLDQVQKRPRKHLGQLGAVNSEDEWQKTPRQTKLPKRANWTSFLDRAWNSAYQAAFHHRKCMFKEATTEYLKVIHMLEATSEQEGVSAQLSTQLVRIGQMYHEVLRTPIDLVAAPALLDTDYLEHTDVPDWQTLNRRSLTEDLSLIFDEIWPLPTKASTELRVILGSLRPKTADTVSSTPRPKASELSGLDFDSQDDTGVQGGQLDNATDSSKAAEIHDRDRGKLESGFHMLAKYLRREKYRLAATYTEIAPSTLRKLSEAQRLGNRRSAV